MHESDVRPIREAGMKKSAVCAAILIVMVGGDVQNELKKLEGSWNVIYMEIDGLRQPKEKSPKQIIITGDKLTGIGPPMSLTLDISRNPKWIDLVFKKGDQSFPIHAIYDVSDDELRICMPVAQPGILFENKRP
jgi:uncharacterized protein (TIGR03067 family)